MNTDDRTTEPANGRPAADRGLVTHVEIRVTGHLGARWSTWFDGMVLTREDDDTTVISGPVVDQAALHGLLQTLRDLGVGLVSLTPLDGDGAGGPRHPIPSQPRHTPGAPS